MWSYQRRNFRKHQSEIYEHWNNAVYSKKLKNDERLKNTWVDKRKEKKVLDMIRYEIKKLEQRKDAEQLKFKWSPLKVESNTNLS